MVRDTAALADQVSIRALIVSGEATAHGLNLAIAGLIDRLVIDSSILSTSDVLESYRALTYSRTRTLTLILSDVHTQTGIMRVTRFFSV